MAISNYYVLLRIEAAHAVRRISQSAFPFTLASSPPPKFRFDNLFSRSELVEIIAPILHHLHPLIPMLSAQIGAPDIVAFDMRQAAHRHIGKNGSLLIGDTPSGKQIESRAKHRPNFFLRDTFLPERSRSCLNRLQDGHMAELNNKLPSGN